MASFKNVPRTDLRKKFPGTPPEGIDFLDKLLVFNPYFRMTLEDAINHPFFDNVRSEHNNCDGSKVILDFEKKELEIHDLRKLFIKEISHF